MSEKKKKKREGGVYYYSQSMDCGNVHLSFLVCSAFLPFVNCPAPTTSPPPFFLAVRATWSWLTSKVVSSWTQCWDDMGIQCRQGWYTALRGVDRNVEWGCSLLPSSPARRTKHPWNFLWTSLLPTKENQLENEANRREDKVNRWREGENGMVTRFQSLDWALFKLVPPQEYLSS